MTDNQQEFAETAVIFLASLALVVAMAILVMP